MRFLFSIFCLLLSNHSFACGVDTGECADPYWDAPVYREVDRRIYPQQIEPPRPQAHQPVQETPAPLPESDGNFPQYPSRYDFERDREFVADRSGNYQPGWQQDLDFNRRLENRPRWGGPGSGWDQEYMDKKEDREAWLRDQATRPPPRYQPKPYTPSKELLTLEAAVDYAIEQQKRYHEAREKIKGMDLFEARSEILDHAKNAHNIARAHYFKYEFEDGSIASEVAEVLIDLATSLTPGIRRGRDVYEALSGKDLHSGEDLGTFARTMAILGAATFGFASKPDKAIGIFQKLTRIEAKVSFDFSRKVFGSKPLSEIKETMLFFKKHKFWKQTDEMFTRFVTAFEMKTTKTKVLAEDTKAFRYYDPRFSEPRGEWLTPHKVKNPEMELALKHPGDYEAYEWIIPKGTEVLEGTVASKFGKPGGAYQIFVPNCEILR